MNSRGYYVFQQFLAGLLLVTGIGFRSSWLLAAAVVTAGWAIFEQLQDARGPATPCFNHYAPRAAARVVGSIRPRLSADARVDAVCARVPAAERMRWFRIWRLSPKPFHLDERGRAKLDAAMNRVERVRPAVLRWTVAFLALWLVSMPGRLFYPRPETVPVTGPFVAVLLVTFLALTGMLIAAIALLATLTALAVAQGHVAWAGERIRRASDEACKRQHAGVLLAHCQGNLSAMQSAADVLDGLDPAAGATLLRERARTAHEALVRGVGAEYVPGSAETPAYPARTSLAYWTTLSPPRRLTPLRLALLALIERVRDTSYLPDVRRVAARTRNPEVRAAASRCLVALEEAVRRGDEPALLLHPAQPATADELLRGARASSEATPAAALLRPGSATPGEPDPVTGVGADVRSDDAGNGERRGVFRQ